MGMKGRPAAPACRREIMPKWEYSSHSRLAGFHRRAHDAQRADARVAHIGKNDLAGAAGRHHLIVDQVRRGARQHQVLAPLADDLMPGGKGDQVGKPGGVHAIAVMDVLLDGFVKRAEFGHDPLLSLHIVLALSR